MRDQVLTQAAPALSREAVLSLSERRGEPGWLRERRLRIAVWIAAGSCPTFWTASAASVTASYAWPET